MHGDMWWTRTRASVPIRNLYAAHERSQSGSMRGIVSNLFSTHYEFHTFLVAVAAAALCCTPLCVQLRVYKVHTNTEYVIRSRECVYYIKHTNACVTRMMIMFVCVCVSVHDGIKRVRTKCTEQSEAPDINYARSHY